MKEKNIIVVSRGDWSRGKTNWKKLDKLTDAEIESAMANDPEWADFNEVDWSDAVLVMPLPPKKKAISIRIDEDVLDFFKQAGAGYQRRVNAVLRSYMRHRKGRP